jgi:lipopolysaccharide assembly outer membrane protein LptD (OstA)
VFVLLGLVPFSARARAQDDVTLQAETQQQLGEGLVKAEGYVSIRSGPVHLTADRVDFWPDEGRVVAEGNVVYQQDDQKIVATRLEADLNTRTGRFHNAYGTAGSDLYFYGDIIEKTSEDTYVIERGAFTSCAQPTPRWRFTAGRATVKRDHHVSLHNSFLRVKSLPVLYLPYLYYPINEEQRSTGFLLPRIGNSSLKGFIFDQAFFWAINRSMDATFTFERFSEIGNGGSVEYRYVESPDSRGEITTFFIQNSQANTREYTINAFMNQRLPANFKAVARVDFFSSFEFQQQFQENYNRATQRSKRASGTVSGSFNQYNLRVLFDRNDTSFGDRVAIRKVLPSVKLTSRPSAIFGTPILFSFDSEATSLARTSGDNLFAYERFDVLPTVSYPFTGLSYLTARMSLSGRWTHYTSALAGGELEEADIDRRYFETGMDVRGPTFARIFNKPDGGYAAAYKHVIEPQVVWSYRSRIDNFDEIPKFDGQDYVPGTNQVAFSLVNRLLAKRIVGGKEQQTATEMLTWTLSQRYFFSINASLYDPQFSTPYYSEDGLPSSRSPITSRVNFRPSRSLTASWNLDYDINFNAVRSSSTSATYGGRWGSVRGLWTRRNIPDRNVKRSNFRVGTAVNLRPGVQVDFDTSYDVTERALTNLRAGVVYNVQCCGFTFDFNRFSFPGFREENTFRFGITLANVGSFGTSLGGSGRVY